MAWELLLYNETIWTQRSPRGSDKNASCATLTLLLTSVAPHPEADCVTVYVWPAIVRVPSRGGPELAATLKATEPVPVPDEPLPIVTQLALLVADQVVPESCGYCRLL